MPSPIGKSLFKRVNDRRNGGALVNNARVMQDATMMMHNVNVLKRKEKEKVTLI